MEYKQNTLKDDGVRYVIENGKAQKKYLFDVTDNGVLLRNKKIFDPADRPKLYPPDQIFTTKSAAEKNIF